jgi:hypothetical protein
MAIMEQISQYFTGYFLPGSTLTTVFIGAVDTPIGSARVPPQDSVHSAQTPENCSEEPNRGPKPGLGAPFWGQLLGCHSSARRGITPANNEKKRVSWDYW